VIEIKSYTCSSSRRAEEGDRETEASLSPTKPQEDGKCCRVTITITKFYM